MTFDKEANEKLLEIKNLKKYFFKKRGLINPEVDCIKAVDDISFYIKKGETLGLVGESGCGKSTAGRTIIGLYPSTSGEIIYKGVDISKLKGKGMMPYRKKMQMIFQDPYASLNPRMTVADIIGEPLDIHGVISNLDRQERIHELLHRVGLRKEHAGRYPHEFSGGQRQRIGIARALAVNPEFIICDEPISALDVSIQAQVVNMLEDLQSELGLTYLFIAHDLSMIKHISNRVGVMYLGALMEVADNIELYKNPLHPYTKALLSSIPIPDPDISELIQRIVLQGDVPSPLNTPEGCKFKDRCSYKMNVCSKTTPVLRIISDEHYVACHMFNNC